MYGALTGLSKNRCAQLFGEAQVKIWRRSYSVPPPPLPTTDPRHPCQTSPQLYQNLSIEIPQTESLKDVFNRVLPFYRDRIEPKLRAPGAQILIVTHGSVIRALMKHLDSISDVAIEDVDIPNGIPLVYHLDSSLKAVKSYFLASEAEVLRAQENIRNQGKSTKAKM
uniref:phosphoglycerate mutase (2,3-diphosphoglycerate-dependent) n=1 Tax=Arcella intermedia TaxID=1963864 RepID=A0A6B2LM17_9EUKA